MNEGFINFLGKEAADDRKEKTVWAGIKGKNNREMLTSLLLVRRQSLVFFSQGSSLIFLNSYSSSTEVSNEVLIP